MVTFNRTLSNLIKIVHKHWHVLKADNQLKKVFAEAPLLAYRRNKNIKEFIGSNCISNNEVVRPKTIIEKGECSPCYNKTGALCCSQVNKTSNFRSTKGETFEIRHNVNCKSKNVLYLVDCTLCKKPLYVGKSEYPMNIRINKHRFDSIQEDEETLEICDHFKEPGHSFNANARFTIIELIKRTFSKDDTRNLLKKRENFWIKRLKTLSPFGLNQYLNRL